MTLWTFEYRDDEADEWHMSLVRDADLATVCRMLARWLHIMASEHGKTGVMVRLATTDQATTIGEIQQRQAEAFPNANT